MIVIEKSKFSNGYNNYSRDKVEILEQITLMKERLEGHRKEKRALEEGLEERETGEEKHEWEDEMEYEDRRASEGRAREEQARRVEVLEELMAQERAEMERAKGRIQLMDELAEKEASKRDEQLGVLQEVNSKLMRKDASEGRKAWEEATMRALKGEAQPDERRKVQGLIKVLRECVDSMYCCTDPTRPECTCQA